MKELYVIIGWPEIQEYMELPEWDECLPIADEMDYAVPKYLYDEQTRR